MFTKNQGRGGALIFRLANRCLHIELNKVKFDFNIIKTHNLSEECGME